MATITHKIKVNGNEARVTNHPKKRELVLGDTVTFEEVPPGSTSEIMYREYSGDPPPKTQKGSPFGTALSSGKRYKVSDGTVFTVTRACSEDEHFSFACGRDVGGVFTPWANPPMHKAKGNTPGPEV